MGTRLFADQSSDDDDEVYDDEDDEDLDDEDEEDEDEEPGWNVGTFVA